MHHYSRTKSILGDPLSKSGNLLISVLQSKLQRRWSFSGLATIVRIVLMYYLNLEKFLNQPDADLNIMLAEASESPPESIEF